MNNVRLILLATGLALLGTGTVSAAPLIYESFADSDSTLDGNASGTGLSGNWVGGGLVFGNSTNTVPVVDDSSSIDYGSLAVSGNNVQLKNKSQGSISIGTTLTDAGLMDHGATLWFSMTVARPSQADAAFAAFALGSDPLLAGNTPEISNSGSAIGFNLDRGYRVRATAWSAGSRTNGGQNNTSTTGTLLMVGRITWGADALSADTIDLFLPGTDLAQPASVWESHSAVLDQSTFDTLMIAGRESGSALLSMDEIRLGASYSDVVVAAAAGIDPRITSFTSVGTNLWELTLTGEAGTAYEFYSSTTLDFTPGTLVENLTQGDSGDPGTIGGTSDSVLTTDASGDGKVRLTLTGDPADFLRARTLP